MELEKSPELLKFVTGVKKQHFPTLNKCSIACYEDMTERKTSANVPIKLKRASAEFKLETKRDLVCVVRGPQWDKLTPEEQERWVVRMLAKVDENDGIFSVASADLQISRAEIERLGPPPEIEEWQQESLPLAAAK